MSVAVILHLRDKDGNKWLVGGELSEVVLGKDLRTTERLMALKDKDLRVTEFRVIEP